MAQVTSPIILDSTGQQIHSDLQQIKNVLTTPSAAEDITFDNTGTGMQADDVQDAITELKSNLTDYLPSKLVSGALPSSANVETKVVNDSTILNNYVIVGYCVYYNQIYYTWINDTSIKNIKIKNDGIYVTTSAPLANATIYITLAKMS